MTSADVLSSCFPDILSEAVCPLPALRPEWLPAACVRMELRPPSQGWGRSGFSCNVTLTFTQALRLSLFSRAFDYPISEAALAAAQ